MSLSLGTLEIGLGLNTTQYDAGIKSAKDQLSSLENYAQKIARDIEWSLKQSIPKLTIVPVVDHRPLHGLNKHLSEKQSHAKSVQGYFNSNPLTPLANTTELKSLQNELTITEEKQNKVSKNVKKDVVKPATDDSRLKDLQQEHQKTTGEHETTSKKVKKNIKPETDDQNLKKLQKEHKKTEDRHFKVRGGLTSKSLSASVNLKSLLGLQNKYANTILDHIKTRAVLNDKSLKVSVDTEDLDKLAEKLVSMASKETIIKAKAVTSEQKNSSGSSFANSGGFGTAITVELLSQILTATRESVQNREGFLSKVMAAPAQLIKNYSAGVAYSYADIATRNSVKAFDKKAGTDLYNTAGGFVGEFAGQKFVEGRQIIQDHLATESGQKASEKIKESTEESRKEMAKLKQLSKEFYDTQDPQKAKELATQILRASEALGKVATTPADVLVNARKELKTDESIQKAKEQAKSLELTQEGIADAKRIVLVSGGFAGQKGESSKAIAKSIQQKMGDGVVVVPIANKATDLSVSVGQNPVQWTSEAISQPVSQGLSGVNEDSVSMLAAVIKARELNPNAQIDLVGYSGGGFVSEGATRLANQAGIENLRGIAFATPGMVGTTKMPNFSPYIGEKDPLRLAEQVLNPIGIARPNQVISNVTSHDFSNYIENTKVIEILNEEIEVLQENIQSIPLPNLFDLSTQKKDLVNIETELQNVEEIAKSLDDLEIDLWKTNNQAKSLIDLQPNTSIKIAHNDKINNDDESMISLFKQTRELKTVIKDNPNNADIAKAQAQTDAIRKWFSGRYKKLKDLINSNELQEAKNVANEILAAKKQASTDLEDILEILRKSNQPTSIASGGVGASVQSAKGYLSSTEKRVWSAQENINKKELSPVKSALAHQLQQKGIDTTSVGFKTLFSKAIEQSAKSIVSGGNRELIEANLQKLVLSLKPVLQNQNRINDLGSDIVEGIKIGIRNESGDLDDEMREIALSLPKTIKTALEIKSPSKVMIDIGRNIGLGLIGGLSMTWDRLKILKKEASSFVDEMQSLGKQSIQNSAKNKIIGLARQADQRLDTAKYIGKKVLNSTGIPDIIDDFNKKNDLAKLNTIANGVEQSFNKLPIPIKKIASLLKDALVSIIGFNVLESSIQLLIQFGKESFQSALNMERIETALDFSTENAESSLAKLKIQADRLGTSFLSSAKNYQQFSASVINTPLEFQKDRIFEGITLGLATRGANSQQQDRALLAITQMASKGRVSMEELNSQLGEALPGALQIAARAYGVTSQEFIKLIESGSVASDEFLSKFATQTTLESAGNTNTINDTAFVQVARFQNQMESLRISLGEPLLEATKLGLPSVTKALKVLTENGELVATVLASIGIVSIGGLTIVLKNLGLIDLALKALGVTAASTRGAVSQIGGGLLKGLGWTALIYGVMEAFKGLYQYINAGSEESKRSLKSTQESLQELRRLLEKPLPTPKASTVITDSATAIQRFKNNRERDKSLEFTAGGLSDTTQILRLSIDTFSDTKITEFTNKLDALRQKTKDLKIDEIIASGDADVKKATSVRQEIAKVNQEIQALTEKYFPQIGLIVNEIASTEERITAIKKVLDDPESSKSQKDNASIQLEVAEAQLRKLKESQEKYNEAVKENLINYQRLTEQINKVARALSNIEFISSGRTILSETDIKRQVLSGNLRPFEIDLTVKEQSLSIVKDQFNSLNGLLVTKEKELQNTLTDQINQRITELMPELNGIDFRTALQQGSVSPEAIGDRLQQLGDQAPFELKQVLETAKQQASIRRQTLTIDKSIVDTELEIANARRERARNARQASIVGANVNERIATLRQLPLGGPVASYRDALSEVRNQERLLEEAYRRLESASDDPNVIQQEVDNTRLALEQARANLLQQQTSLQDYYRNLDRQIIDFNRQIEDYRRQIEDAQLSAFKENRSLSESYGDLVRELDKNLLNAQNQLLDTTDRIRVQQVKNRLLIPGTSDAGKELGDIFLEFVQGQADLASRGRTFQSRTEEIETSYISTLRNIRNLQEQQQEAERNRLKTIEDIKRTQENLNRTLADLIRQTNKELGFIPQSIKDIVTNLNTLPEPIKLINSELVAIPPNIKTSGEDLVKSIEETAEAIRKANEQISQPLITGQFDSNLLPVPFLPKSRNGYLPPPPPSQSPSQSQSQSSSMPKGLTRRGQELFQHLDDPHVKAFLDTIAYAEGTFNMPNKGYNTLFGHGQFSSFATHPNIHVPFGNTTSTAAGRYQAMNFVWDEEKVKLGLKDFSPISQDLLALSRILMRGGLDELLKGDIRGVINAAHKEWASFPGANYPGQGMKRMEDLVRFYQQSLQKYQPSNQPRTTAELEALQYNGNPANSGALNRVQQIRRNHGSQGGPEFSSPPSIAQLPTLPNQNQDNFWDADLPPVPKDNPINFQNPNLPPVPNLPTANLGTAADQIREAEIADQNSQEFLRRLEEQQNLNNALDRLIKFRQQQEEDARALERSLRDASENVADLIINSKGYLTVQEEINKSATEVSRQYRSQIESLEDQRRTLLLNADAMKKRSEVMKDELQKELKRNPNTPISVVEETTKAIEILAKRAELAKEQVAILDQAIEQLGKNQGVATLEASFRRTRDTVRSLRDRLNDLTIQRMRLEFQSSSGLFDNSAILAERISLQKEKEELEDYLEPYKDLPEYADFVANIRSEWEKLAELRLERVALDASPNRGAAESFFSDIREGKGIGSAFSSLGLNIMTKFVEGITKPAIDALTSAIDGFTKPITQAFESVFNAIIGPVGNFFTNALNSIFKPVGNIFSSIFGGGGGGGLFNGLLSGITGVFSGGLGGLGSIGSASIAPSSFASAPASAFSLGTGFSLFSDGGKVGDVNTPIEKNIISAFQRERAMSGGRKPRLIVANEDELVLNPKETEAYLEYRNNAPIKNYANGGFVGGKPNYSTTSNNNSSNQSLVINNTNNVTVESRNDMGYSLNQLKERENAQNERTKKRFFG